MTIIKAGTFKINTSRSQTFNLVLSLVQRYVRKRYQEEITYFDNLLSTAATKLAQNLYLGK